MLTGGLSRRLTFFTGAFQRCSDLGGDPSTAVQAVTFVAPIHLCLASDKTIAVSSTLFGYSRTGRTSSNGPSVTGGLIRVPMTEWARGFQHRGNLSTAGYADTGRAPVHSSSISWQSS